MENFKVLWFDDEHITLELIKEQALENDIDLIGFSNAEEGLIELNQNYRLYDAVLLDGLFFQDADQSGSSKNDDAFGEVALELKSINDKGYVLPWFILSGQKSFVKDRNSLVNTFTKKKFGSKAVYDKKADEDYDQLFNDIKTAANNVESIKLRRSYNNVFEVCEDKYLGSDVAPILLKAIEIVHNPTKDNNAEELFTPLRMVIERMYTKLNEVGILPDAIAKQQGWINKSARFLVGNDHDYIMSEEFMPPLIKSTLLGLMDIIQDASHKEGGLALNVQGFMKEYESTYVYNSIVFQLFDILLWLKTFIDTHPDAEKNRSLWGRKDLGEKNWISGKITEIQKNGYATFKPLTSTQTIGIRPDTVEHYKLEANQLIEITTRLNHDGTKTYIDKIKC